MRRAFLRLWGSTLLLLLTEPQFAKDKKKGLEPYAVVGGTVFREGFSLPGAEVSLTKEGDNKFKPMKSLSDSRGEFAFRVPVVPQKYTLHVRRAGFQPQQKDVAVEGEQRFEVNFNLEPDRK